MTGSSADDDEIIEIGAVRFNGHTQDGEPFHFFIRDTRPVPYPVRRLTGIREDELRSARALPLDEALRRLADYIDDAPLVGHNIATDVAFLRAAGMTLRNPLLDTYDLAVTLLPDLKTYGLEAIATHLGIGATRYHRALDDAQTTRRVFLTLLARLQALDLQTREGLARLPHSAPWTVSALLEAEPGRVNGATPPSELSDLGTRLAEQSDISARVYQFGGIGQTPTPPFATSDEMAAVAGQVAPLVRPAVAERAHRLLVEGGALLLDLDNDQTDLVSLLAPAARWAVDTGGRVVISAPTPAIMSRLAREVTPHAFAAAGVSRSQISVAELGERESYLCLRRWFGGATVADGAAVTPGVTRGLARLTIWLKSAQRGARVDLSLLRQEEYGWERARAGIEVRDSAQSCPYDATGYCFLTAAQKAANAARIVVTTHKALAAALLGRDDLLPKATRVIALDPHALEEALREARTHALRYTFVSAVLSDLATTTEEGQPAGVLHWAWRALCPTDPARGQAWAEMVNNAQRSAESFFAALHMFGHVIEPNLEQRAALVDDEARYGSAWHRVSAEWGALRGALDNVINLLRVIATDAKTQSPRATSEPGSAAVELLFAARQLEVAREAGEELLTPATRGLVTWIERPDTSAEGATTPRGLKISGGPVQCDTDLLGVYPAYGDAVRPLTANGNGLLLAGPGLAAGGDFEFPRVLFGMPTEARAANFGRDRAEQTLLCLPTDVPAPNRDHYQERLNQTLIRLALELEGRLVVYFASRNSLREGAQGIRKTLERNGILVLAQGIDGPPHNIWRTFNREQRVVLLGGGGYWQSDIEPTRRSYCIVIPRLPIPAESDPVHKARGERWDDHRGRYFIPAAAQRMRIALSRLAWSHEDRNAILLFDRRAHSGDDGHTTLATLPRCRELRAPVDEITREISDWIGPA
jgi:DNA polymerase-3 subunit epsilon/ATP-dependent DNA helicase DinG